MLQLIQSVTHILHNGMFPSLSILFVDGSYNTAWRVNFNVTLSSFKSNIQGLRKLIDLALSTPSPPTIAFISSIAVLSSTHSFLWVHIYDHTLDPQIPIMLSRALSPPSPPKSP
jgi:hypothetical protein